VNYVPWKPSIIKTISDFSHHIYGLSKNDTAFSGPNLVLVLNKRTREYKHRVVEKEFNFKKIIVSKVNEI
jgi:hypothetical protein